MKHRTGVLLLALFCIPLISGCWDRVELDNLGIVGAVGVDISETDDSVILTAQVIRPTGIGTPGQGTGGRGPYWVIRASAKTAFEAIRKLSTISSRRLFFSHNQVIVFGERAASRGIADHLDLFVRDEELRPTAYVLVTRGTASEFLDSDGGFQRVSALGYAQLVENRSATSKTVLTTVQDLHEALPEKDSVSLLPVIEHFLAEREPQVDQDPSASPLDSATPSSDESQITFRLGDTAVLRGDRLVGYLSQEETRGRNWVTDEVGSGIVVVEIESGRVDVEILNARGEISPAVIGKEVSIIVEVKVDARIGSQQLSLDLSSPAGMKLLSVAVSGEIKAEINQALRKARDLNVDIFGFRETIMKQRPKDWEMLKGDWDSAFRDIEVMPQIRVIMRRFGVTSKPLRPEE